MARQHPKPNSSTPSFNTSHSFQHPSPAEARGMEVLLPEAVMESHEREEWGVGGLGYVQNVVVAAASSARVISPRGQWSCYNEAPCPMAWPASFRWTCRDSQSLREFPLESVSSFWGFAEPFCFRVHAEKLCGR